MEKTPVFIARQRDIIRDILRPLIPRKVVLWQLPYHDNVGDHLIWRGEEAFLKSIGVKIAGRSGVETCWFPKLDSSVGILLHGGGNFGDIYPVEYSFRNKVVANYPDNPIIILPQSIHYNDIERAREDACLFATHKNLTICARDGRTYEKMLELFPGNKILLCPDMAFHMDLRKFRKYRSAEHPGQGRTLWFHRQDVEKTDTAANDAALMSLDSFDWHDDGRFPASLRYYFFLNRVNDFIKRKFPAFSHLSSGFCDLWMRRVVHPRLIRHGCRKLRPYDNVVCDRLHAMILSLILGKKVRYIDNSAGKLSAYAETWLQGCNGQIARY